MLRRFEVSKRIHGGYTESWKPRDPKDYRNLSRYVRFAEVLDLAHTRLHDLRYMSALMKCLDTLVALRSDVEQALLPRLARLLVSEQAHVDRLAGGDA